LVKFFGSFYCVAVLLNNSAERYIRNRCIDKVYLTLDSHSIPDSEVIVSPKQDGTVSKKLEIHLINGKIIKGVEIQDNVKLIDYPSKEPDTALIKKIKLTLTEMYMNEYYEVLSKNFVRLSKENRTYFLFYN
jgi:hypothetical protein